MLLFDMSIRSFKCRDTERLFRLERVSRFIAIERPALRKLKQLDLAQRLNICGHPQAIGWRDFEVIALVSGAYGSMTSFVSAFAGSTVRRMLKLSITIKGVQT